MEISFTKKGKIQIGGFHIDSMNALENSGLIEFSEKVMYKNDCYKAKLLCNGEVAKDTASFFPFYWSNEQVIDAVFEAYDEYIKRSKYIDFQSSSSCKIKGFLNNGIEVEMVITKSGKIKTAYPLLK